MGHEKAGLACGGDQAGIQPQHDIGRATRPFEPKPPQKCRAVTRTDKVERAAAFGLESLLDRGAGAPVRDETVIGIDGQHRCLRQCGAGHQQGCKQEMWFHSILQYAAPCGQSGGQVWRLSNLPSAGFNRFRFNGFAVWHLSAATSHAPRGAASLEAHPAPFKAKPLETAAPHR